MPEMKISTYTNCNSQRSTTSRISMRTLSIRRSTTVRQNTTKAHLPTSLRTMRTTSSRTLLLRCEIAGLARLDNQLIPQESINQAAVSTSLAICHNARSLTGRDHLMSKRLPSMEGVAREVVVPSRNQVIARITSVMTTDQIYHI